LDIHKNADSIGMKNQGKKRGAWTNKALKAALDALDDGHKMAEVSKHYKIPRTSLRDHANGKTKCRKYGAKGVLTKEEEKYLCQYLEEMVRWGHALTPTQLRVKVAQLTQTRPTPFTNGMPGISWLKWFRKRHPEFTLRQPQGLEMKRAKALCPENVASLYMNLSNLYDQNKYEPHQIWNIDESGAQACKNGQSTVLAKSGTRVVYTLVPDEREWVTLCYKCSKGNHTKFLHLQREKKIKRLHPIM
jgi:hypothetical protein